MLWWMLCYQDFVDRELLFTCCDHVRTSTANLCFQVLQNSHLEVFLNTLVFCSHVKHIFNSLTILFECLIKMCNSGSIFYTLTLSQSQYYIDMYISNVEYNLPYQVELSCILSNNVTQTCLGFYHSQIWCSFNTIMWYINVVLGSKWNLNLTTVWCLLWKTKNQSTQRQSVFHITYK